jgi:hypothetical protein
MTITTNDVRDEYTASAAQTVFNYTFKIFADGQLNVYITPSGQEADDSTDITTAYTIDPSSIGDEDGGFITLNSGTSSGDLVTIVSNIPEARTTDYQNSGDFRPDTVNADFDTVVSLTKQQDDRTSRTLSFQESEQNVSSLSLPRPEGGLYLAWNLAETGVVNQGSPGSVIPANTESTIATMKANTSLTIGLVVNTKGGTSEGDGGDATYLVVANQSVDGIVDHLNVNGNALLILPVNGEINILQAGCVADGTTGGGTNNSPFVNGAIQWVRDNLDRANTVRGSIGAFSIGEPIRQLNAVNFYSASTLSGSAGGTEFICNFSAFTIANPPTDNLSGLRFSPVLLFTPMYYNTELLSQIKLGGFRWNGNDKDVYGSYLNDAFYTNWRPTFHIGCNKSPFTLIASQFNYMEMLTCNNNKGPVRIIGCSTLQIDGLDTEGNLVTGGNCLEIVQDLSSKTNITINNWHYEETATDFPDTFAILSGRNITINGISFGLTGTPPARFVELLGAENYSFDGESFTTIVSSGATIDNAVFSTGSSAFRLKSGVTGAYINSSATISAMDDQSGSTTNTFQNRTAAPSLPRGTTITAADGSIRMMQFTDDNTVNFYNNLNRNLRQSGANWIIENTGGTVSIDSSTAVDVNVGGANSVQFDNSSAAGATRMLLFDVDNNTQERVTVGIADSGGAGFKVLRIPN